MHFHQKSTNHYSNSLKALLLILITYTLSCHALTKEEVAEALAAASFEMNNPSTYCGRKLTDAMKIYCAPSMKLAIMKSDESSRGGMNKAKKSMDQEMDSDQFDVSFDEGVTWQQYGRPSSDDLFFTNDIPFMFPSQGNQRRRRGIIESCCKRACLKRDLIKFCPVRG